MPPNISAIVDEFANELQVLATDCAGHPDEEVRHLWQIALERESLVAVAYRRDIIGSRLSRMSIEPDVRDVVARAIRWAWRDEEMHALWMRGVLLREGERPDRARAWKTMLEGRIAGWTSSRQSHYRWTEAPVKRTVAEALEWSGRLTGRIPESVAGELHFQSFHDYCTFNVGAERTAELAWRRMAELATDPAAGVHPEDAAAFAKIADDEVRHGKLFALLAECFGPDDQLSDGVDAQTLTRSLSQIGQRFLSHPTEDHIAWDNPLGKGAPVIVREGPEIRELLRTTLDAVGLDERLARARPGNTVAIKTTFMLGVDRRDLSPMVSLGLLHALIDHLVGRGLSVSVIDAPNIYDRFHHGRAVHQVAEHFGIAHPDAVLVDSMTDQVEHPYLRGMGTGTVDRTWRDASFRIVLGKLRSHPSQLAMLSLDATEGLGGRHDAYTFSDRKADRFTAVLAVADALPPDLALLDAFSDVPDGLTGMMGTDQPLQPRRLYASGDALSLDHVAARHIGAARSRLLLHTAVDWFGDPADRTHVDGVDTPIPGWRSPDGQRTTAVLSRMSLPLWDHASGRGALFIPPMDERAFPPVAEPGPLFRAAREAARGFMGVGERKTPIASLLTTRNVMIDGHSTRVHDAGEGPVIVLLHGYPDSLQIFARLAPLLHGYRVIAFDWPGQGYSEAWEGPLDPVRRTAQLIQILDHLDLQRAHLLASDMGAHPALVAAADHPDRIDQVVVMNALLFGDGPTSTAIQIMRRSGLNRAAFRLTPGVVWRRCMDTFMDESLPEPHAADMWAAFSQRSVREQLITLCDDTEAALPTLPERYWQITRPVLALWGEAESHFPVAQAERLVGLLPESRLVVLPQAGHWAVWSHAEAVAEATLSFLGED